MSFELRDVQRLLDAFEESDWDEIHLSSNGFQLHVVARAALKANGPTAGNGHVADQRSWKSSAPMPSSEPSAEAHEDASRSEPVTAAPAAPGPGDGTVIASPSLGIFWRSPRPGAPPFVEVGDEVVPGMTLCIVEVMKLMTPLKAEAAGTVTAVLVENGDAIEQGQALFTISSEPALVDLTRSTVPAG